MRAAPIIINTTPAHRTEETLSFKNTNAANVVITKLKAVSGHRKLMSLLDISTNKQAKNNASKNTPISMDGLLAPDLSNRTTSDELVFLTSPIWFIPFLSKVTPAASKTRPISKIKRSLVMLQISVANEFDTQSVNLRADARAHQGIQFVLK